MFMPGIVIGIVSGEALGDGDGCDFGRAGIFMPGISWDLDSTPWATTTTSSDANSRTQPL
jgi:hypothetical protein